MRKKYLYFRLILDSGNNSPAQSSGRSISPNIVANNNNNSANNGHTQAILTPSQLQLANSQLPSSPLLQQQQQQQQTLLLLNQSPSLGSLAPSSTFSSPQVRLDRISKWIRKN
jgi:hypothetical protein